MMTAQVRALISQAGSRAAAAGADITDCPFDSSAGGSSHDRERARVWVGGYLQARPPAPASIDYSLGDAHDQAAAAVASGHPAAPAITHPGHGAAGALENAARPLLHPTDQAGHESQLRSYWLHGEGAAKWATWSELRDHLVKHVGPERADRIAATWFHERYGIWPGDHRNHTGG